MAQQRVFDYGDPLNSPDDNETRQYLETAGVYSGFTFSVDASFDLEIAPGAGLQPNGILWTEDTAVGLTFSAPGVDTNYTVVATHVNRNIIEGVPVEYAIQTGLSTTVTDGIVLGWIYYTGTGTLMASHLVEAPKVKEQAELLVDTAPVQLRMPLQGTWSDTATMGGNVTFVGQTESSLLFDSTYFVTHQKVSKVAGPAATPETLVQHVQFFATDRRPVGFDLYCNIPGAAQLQVELRDTDLNIVTITGSPISTTTDWEWQTITVDRTDGTFATGQPYELRLTHSVDLNQEISLAHVVARYYPYPT